MHHFQTQGQKKGPNFRQQQDKETGIQTKQMIHKTQTKQNKKDLEFEQKMVPNSKFSKRSEGNAGVEKITQQLDEEWNPKIN